jgi:hypothetical protein
MALKDAFSSFQQYDGQLIHLTISQNSFDLKTATEDDEALWLIQRITGRSTIQLDFEFDYAEVTQLKTIRADRVKSIGAKAFNLLQIMRMEIKTVNSAILTMAFVIPFSFFKRFISSVAAPEFAAIVDSGTSEAAVKDTAKRLREKIERSRIGDDLKIQLMRIGRIWRDSKLCGDGVIFRSSTNCEDIPGFPSAGLY